MTVETRASGRAEGWGAVLLGAGGAGGLLVLSALAFASVDSVTPNILGCTEGSEQACQIPPSGCPGVRICIDGSWGSCACVGGGGTGRCDNGYPSGSACRVTGTGQCDANCQVPR